jgi:hypothetical protein
VMWRVYHRLFGEPAQAAHEFRLKLFEFAGAHIQGCAEQFRQAMLHTYRRGMSHADLQISWEREEAATTALGERMKQAVRIDLFAIVQPVNNPVPEQLKAVLSTYDQ